MRRNPYVFVVGCPRSGTTLLQRMLDHHPQLAVANDTHFISKAIEKVLPHAIEDVSQGADPPLTPDLVDWVCTSHRFARLDLADAIIHEVAAKSSTYRAFVSSLYEEYARQRGKPIAGEKTPDYVRRLPLLHGLCPWTKVVHIIRDGRDVCLSTLEWARDDKGPGRFELWEEEPVAVCALWWSWQVDTGMRDGTVLGTGTYRDLRYEDLVAKPEETLRGLTAFLELPFEPQMLAFHEGKTRHEPGLSAKKAWMPPTPGLRDWRTQLPERDVGLFEALAGDLLSALGYERAGVAISPEIMAVAERCRQWWDGEMARRRALFTQRVESRMDSPSGKT